MWQGALADSAAAGFWTLAVIPKPLFFRPAQPDSRQPAGWTANQHGRATTQATIKA